jgi:hypothetical protein
MIAIYTEFLSAGMGDRLRLGIDYRFFAGDSRSTKHYLDLTQRRVIAPNS